MHIAYHQGIRVIAGCANVKSSITTDEARVQLNVLPLEDTILMRRLGLFHRVLRTGSEWMLGLFAATAEDKRGWSYAVTSNLGTLSEFEDGQTPALPDLLQGIAATKPQHWKARLKKFGTARLLYHATQQDIVTMQKYQQEALLSLGLSSGTGAH